MENEVITHIERSPGQKLRVEQMIQNCQLPHFHLSMEINASAIFAKINGWAEENRPSFTTFLIQGIGKTLQTVPVLNGTLTSDGTVAIPEYTHLAIGVETPDGLQFPVLQDVMHKNIIELDGMLKQFELQAEKGALLPEEMAGATFTLVNFGVYGISECRTILPQNHVAMLTAGTISYHLVMTGNRIINLPFFMLTLTADYRVVDETLAAKFLRKLKESLEE